MPRTLKGSTTPMPAGDLDALPAGLEDAAEAAAHGEFEPEPDGRPEIRISTAEASVVKQALRALTADPDIYARGGHLARVTSEAPRPGKRPESIVRDPDAPRIAPLPEPWVQVRLAADANWFRAGKDPETGLPVWLPAHPPLWAVRAVATAGQYPGMRPLVGVVETPTLRADGTILDRPGYDESTGLIYRPLGRPPQIPARPSRADALAARDRLLDVVRDFPFARPEHEGAWLAAVLTPLCRWAFAGSTPLFLFDANTRGAGKSLLARVAALIATGRSPPATTLPADEDERRKRMTAFALAGDSLMLLDNVEGVLGGATLNAALTTDAWADRILGSSVTTGTLPWRTVILATGNNATLGADTARRTVQIKLESPEERPEARQGFAHPDLVAWVRAERARLVGDALTICRGYFVAGRPDMRLPAMGSFEGWSLVRQIVTWAGLPDPLTSQVALAETADREAALLRGLLDGLGAAVAHLGRPATVRGLLDFATGPDGHELRDLLAEHLPGRDGGLPDARRLSARLRHLRGRVSGGRAIDLDGSGHGGRDLWVVRQATPAAEREPGQEG